MANANLPTRKHRKKFRAIVFSSEYYEADILAADQDKAWDIARSLDGGLFSFQQNGEWDIIEVSPVDDDDEFHPANA